MGFCWPSVRYTYRCTNVFYVTIALFGIVVTKCPVTSPVLPRHIRVCVCVCVCVWVLHFTLWYMTTCCVYMCVCDSHWCVWLHVYCEWSFSGMFRQVTRSSSESSKQGTSWCTCLVKSGSTLLLLKFLSSLHPLHVCQCVSVDNWPW